MLKLLIGAVVGCALGVLIGYPIAENNLSKKWVVDMSSYARASAAEQYYAANLSAAALMRLERGEIDQAKRLFASQAASYYQHFSSYDASVSDRPHLMPLIRAASEHSAMLREELAKEAAAATPRSPTPISN